MTTERGSVTGAAAVYGILGWPVRHSLSPAMQTRALAVLGVEGVYVPFPVAPGSVRRALDGLFAAGVRGLNVTAPLKEEAALTCRSVSDAAWRAASANTLVRRDDGWHGETTDGEGLVAWLATAGRSVAGRGALVLGAGGAARSAAQALLAHGAARVVMAARHPARARAAVADLVPGGEAPLSVAALDARALRSVLEDVGLVVGCLPGDALDDATASALLEHAPAGALVVDLAYEPREPALVAAARKRRLEAANGLGVLLHQGVLSLGLWLGMPRPASELRDALQAALEAIGEGERAAEAF